MIRRAVWLAVAVLMFAGGCGGDEASPETGVADAEASAENVQGAEGAAEPESDDPSADDVADTSEPSVAVEIVPSDAPFLSSVLASPIGDSGAWPLEVGSWVTGAFDSTIEFQTSEALELVVEGKGIVELRSQMVAADHGITIAQGAAFLGPDGSETPMPATAAAVDEAFEAHEIVEVVDRGNTGGVDWWDLMLGAGMPDIGYPCYVAERCLDVVVTTGGQVLWLPVDQPLRLYRPTLGDTAIGIWVTAPAGDQDQLVAVAEVLATSVEPVEPTSEPGDRLFLRSLEANGTVVPAGTWVAGIGAGSLAFDVGDNDTARFVMAERNTVFLVGPGGTVGIQAALGLVPPESPQIEDIEATVTEGLTDGRGWSADEFGEWLGALTAITDTGSGSLGSLEVAWWDITVDESVDSSPCGQFRTVGGVGDCVNLAVHDLVWFVSSEQPTRVYFSEEAQVFIKVAAEAPGVTIESMLEDVMPVLGGMSFQPAE